MSGCHAEKAVRQRAREIARKVCHKLPNSFMKGEDVLIFFLLSCRNFALMIQQLNACLLLHRRLTHVRIHLNVREGTWTRHMWYDGEKNECAFNVHLVFSQTVIEDPVKKCRLRTLRLTACLVLQMCVVGHTETRCSSVSMGPIRTDSI